MCQLARVCGEAERVKESWISSVNVIKSVEKGQEKIAALLADYYNDGQIEFYHQTDGVQIGR